MANFVLVIFYPLCYNIKSGKNLGVYMGSIYCMYFETDDGKYYIGQSINTLSRYTKHKRLLLTNKHHNKNLQTAYNTFKVLPSIYILETGITKKKLDSREIYWIAEFDSYYNGYNSTLGGRLFEYGDTIDGRKYPKYVYSNILFDIAYTDNTAKQIAEDNGIPIPIVNSIMQEAAHCYLQEEYPEEYSILRSKRNNRVSKYSTEICEKVFEALLQDIPYQEITGLFSVPYSLVTSIAYGYTHKELRNKYQEKYDELISTRNKSTSNRKRPYPDIVDPQGMVHKVEIARHLAELYSLDPSSLAKVLNGKLKQYKGWRLATV